MVMVPILLLNMLIAMMGNTYAHVIEQSEKEFVKQVKLHFLPKLQFPPPPIALFPRKRKTKKLQTKIFYFYF